MTVTTDTIESIAPGLEFMAVLIRDDFKTNIDEGKGFTGKSVWYVSIKRNGCTFSTEYTMGAAHRHYTHGINDPLLTVKPGDPINLNVRPTIYMAGMYKERTAPNTPDIVNVLWNLTMDANLAKYGDFHEFCVSTGYDEDSREAERIFNACCDTYFAFKRLGLDLDALCELYQDY